MSIYNIPTMAAGLGVWLTLASQARAGDYSYGHAEINLGFPHGQVTVGRTWESEPREVVVERVTHKDPDFEDDEHGPIVEEDIDDDVDTVIVEKRIIPRRKKNVVVVEHIVEEPEYCERVHVVRKVYVEPPCPRREVVVVDAPVRYYCPPSRIVIAPRRHGHGHGHGGIRIQGSGHGHRGHGGGNYDRGSDHGRRELFHESGHRPSRSRGVQMVASSGGRSHSGGHTH